MGSSSSFRGEATSDNLFDVSQSKFGSAKSYHSDCIDATSTDLAWDETELSPHWKNNTTELSGDADYSSTQVPTMAEKETSESIHATVEIVEELSPEEEAERLARMREIQQVGSRVSGFGESRF